MSSKNALDPIRPGEILREDFLEPLGIALRYHPVEPVVLQTICDPANPACQPPVG